MEDKEYHFLSRVQACLLGVQIGDAMGMSWETMTPAEIVAATGGKGITGFNNAVQRKLKETANAKAGDTTDDWQLTYGVARSLIRCKGFNLYDIALEHVLALETCSFGWGLTTKNSIKEVKKYFTSRCRKGRSPITPPPSVAGSKGAGNGVAMKIAPLALWNVLAEEPIENLFYQVMELGFMTHPNPVASLAAYAFAELLRDVFEKPLASDSEKLRKIWNLKSKVFCKRNKTLGLREAVDVLDEKFILVSESLKEKDDGWLREKIGTGCYAPESVFFAIGMFLRHPNNFREAMLEAISAGGDTDSTASMVGALVGANCGLQNDRSEDIVPKEWINFRPEFGETLKFGEEFFQAARIARKVR